MACGTFDREHAPMSKRAAAAVLWFIAGWYLGAVIAYVVGVSDAIGPILAITAAALFGGDPFGVIWKPSAEIQAARTASEVRLEHLTADP
jgi:hypothetical protein